MKEKQKDILLKSACSNEYLLAVNESDCLKIIVRLTDQTFKSVFCSKYEDIITVSNNFFIEQLSYNIGVLIRNKK